MPLVYFVYNYYISNIHKFTQKFTYVPRETNAVILTTNVLAGRYYNSIIKNIHICNLFRYEFHMQN